MKESEAIIALPGRGVYERQWCHGHQYGTGAEYSQLRLDTLQKRIYNGNHTNRSAQAKPCLWGERLAAEPGGLSPEIKTVMSDDPESRNFIFRHSGESMNKVFSGGSGFRLSPE
ncbi:MAG: hypothetical protein R2941_15920 [Desulfobacterales bacterium]